MPFNILDVYKAGVPVGEPYRSTMTSIATDQTTGLTVSPTTTPEDWANKIEKLKIQMTTPVGTGTGAGLLELTYPDYSGENQNTMLFDDEDHIADFADEVIEVNGSTQYIINFKPPITLRASSTYSDLSIGLPENRTLFSGDLSFLITGWKIKESDLE